MAKRKRECGGATEEVEAAMRDLDTRDAAGELPMLSTRAEVVTGSIDEKRRTVDLTWSTGARVLRRSFFRGPFWEELSLDPAHVRMARLQSGTAPLLNAHEGYDARQVLGVVEAARVEGSRGVATVRFSRAEDDPEADRIFRKVQDKILRNVSVGYRTYKMERVEKGDDEKGTYDVLRAVDWEPHEISVVPMGADDGAGFRARDGAKNPCVIVTGEESEMAAKENETTTPAPAPAKSPAEEATRAARAARIEEAKQRAEAETRREEEGKRAERERVSGLRSIGRRAKLGDAWVDALIEAGTGVEEARALAFDKLAEDDEKGATDGHHDVAAGADERDKRIRHGAAWLIERVGLTPMLEEAQRKEPRRFKDLCLDPGDFRGMTLLDLAREFLERAGRRTRGMSRLQLAGEAFMYRAGYQTTSDFAVLLEVAYGKVLLGQYAVTPDTWSLFCGTENLGDFRSVGRYRLGSLSALDVVTEHGEFKTKLVPDASKISIGLQTYGNIIGVTRQTIINDDMGGLRNLATMLGRAAKLTIENAVYALLAQNSGLGPTQGDAQPFFHSNRANVNATGSGITVAGINADATVMALQKDPSSNEYLDLTPAVLLVPRSLKGDADTINSAQYDPADSKFQKPNYVRGMFRTVIGTPRLSGTRRYLFGEPGVAPAIMVTFLEGQGQAPMLDAENGWRVDGVEWKVRLDAKAQMFDPKGAVTNAGA